MTQRNVHREVSAKSGFENLEEIERQLGKLFLVYMTNTGLVFIQLENKIMKER